MEFNEQNIPSQYRPLSPWAYFGYNLLFAIPLIGFIFLIIFAFDNSNLNRRNYARSFFCTLVLVAIILVVVVVLSVGIYSTMSSSVL